MKLDDVDTLSKLKADLEQLETSILMMKDIPKVDLSTIAISFYPKKSLSEMRYCVTNYDLFFFDDIEKAFKAKLERTKELLKAYGVEL